MQTLGLVFGGRSAEHAVSVVSANSLLNGFKSGKFRIVPLHITVSGDWLTPAESLAFINPENHARLYIPGIEPSGLIDFLKTGIDVFFPLLHGTFGEDGTIQGFFEMLGKPYTGAGVLGSSAAMDKDITKIILASGNIPVVPWISFYDYEWEKNKESILNEAERKFRFPVFVKPANAGSSIGISKVTEISLLGPAVTEALKYDQKVIIEAGLPVREIEISVLGNIEAKASLPGEIFPGAEFYDYEDKYITGKSTFKIPADLSEDLIRIIRDYAIRAFKLLNLEGMARIDFFIDRQTGQIYLNEINTIPGFTPISMYPKMWEASGLSYSELLETLISLAQHRFQKRNQISSHFTIKISG